MLNKILELLGIKTSKEEQIKKLEEKLGYNMKAKFEIFKDKGKEWRFRLIANNGKIICASEGYTRRNNCLKGIKAVKKCAGKARTVYL